METLVLIDGNAIIHRAFHAYPTLTAPDGRETNAVYGFCAMFLKILEDLQPEYVVVCFDRAAPTFRKQLFAGYQATRPQVSDGLSPQFGLLHEVLEKMGVEIFEIDGYEADDLIGTISHQAKEQGLSVIIVSGDRDMMQLVNSSVKVLMPVVGVTKTELYDEKKVEEKFGVKPSQIIDYKALVGDASDNYPGVAGIGPKGASNLLKEYETLENIYKHLDDIAAKNQRLATKLAEGAESAGLSQKLATIVTDAPLTFNIKKSACLHLDRDGLEEAFENLGFNSLLKRIPALVKKQEKKKGGEQMGLL